MREESPEHRSFVMSKVPSTGTKPEIAVRKSLFKAGFRYLINVKKLPGAPDIVLPKYRTVIFVHGCFWHGHRNCNYYVFPKTNTHFWQEKIARNQERDQEVWRQLEAKGWFVIIVWECQLKKAHLAETVEAVSAEIRRNGEALKKAKEERRRAQEAYREEQKARKAKESSLLAEVKGSLH